MALSTQLSAPDRHLFPSGTITYLTGRTLSFSGEDVFSFSISEGTTNGMLLGGAFSASCTLTLNNEEEAFTGLHSPWGAQVKLNLGTDEESVPLITFTVTRVVKRENDCRLTLTGSDALGTAFDGAFRDRMSYPRTLLEIARGIASLAGFTLETSDFPNASFSIPSQPDWGEISLRQALAFTACAAGCFARIDRSGRLVFQKVHTPSPLSVIAPENTLQREYGEMEFGPVQALTIMPSGAPRDAAPFTITASGALPTAQNTLSVSRNPLFPYGGSHTQLLGQNLLFAVQGFTLTPARISWRGDPSVQVGSRVRILDSGGSNTVTVVTGQTLSFSRGFSMQSDCAYSAASSSAGRLFTSSGALNAAMLDGSLNGVLIRDGTLAASALIAGSVTASCLAASSVTAGKLAASSVTADKIDAGAVTAGKIAAGAVTADKIASSAVTADKIASLAVTADKIAASAVTADKISSGAVTADKLAAAVMTAIDAHIAAADIDFAHIRDLVAGKAIITQGESGKLFIADLAVTEANMVSLTVGELLVKGQDGGFYSLSVDGQGNVVTAQKLVQNSDVQDAAINGDAKLIEGSVTARTLNAQDVFADSALIRQLIAANLDVDTLFSREATINKLNAIDITGNEFISLYVQRQGELDAWLRITSDGLVIGREGDSAKFVASNRTLEVTNVKTERLGITRAMSMDEEWAWIATNSGLSLKYIGE